MPEKLNEQPQLAAASSLLQAQGQLPWTVALQIVLGAAQSVRTLHESGRLHGTISMAAVRADVSSQAVTLASPGASCSFGGPFSAPDHCPPPLRRRRVIELPTEANAARQVLSDARISLDPVSIDLYQLGTLLCRLGTGEPVSAYLSSPRTKAAVPHAVRTLIDRALGYQEDARFTAVSQFASAVRQAVGDCPSEGPATGLGKNADEALPFSSLGHFQIVARLGRGGMGDVYQGYDPALERKVAIKVLPPELARQEDFVRRFRAEAAAVARLTHPNVVQIHFIGEDQGLHFFAMQCVEGESLAELLARCKRLSVEQTLAIVEQTLAGLAAAHKQGIVHRDVKPANILLDRVNRRALLADFGLVKSVVSGTKMTATGVVMGTVDYISPEQGRGQVLDARSDLYSIGVLMYQMLSGKLPFEADSPTAMIFQHVYEPPPPLCDAAPQVPDSLCRIVHRLLAKSPADRPQTAEETLADLRAFRASQAVSSDPKPAGVAPVARSRPRTVIIQAPVFVESPPWPADLDQGEAPVRGWQRLAGAARDRGQRVRSWLFGLTRGRTPQFVQRWQDTQQQVDGAVAEYERRHASLQQLVTEAEEVLEELKRQFADQRRAAAAARRRADSATDEDHVRQAEQEETSCRQAGDHLADDIAEQQRELETMRVRLAQVNATLQKIRSQRDLLHARWKVAQARIQVAGGPAKRTRTPVSAAAWIVVLVAAGVLAINAAIILWPGRPKADRASPDSPLRPLEVPVNSRPAGDGPRPLPAPPPARDRAAQPVPPRTPAISSTRSFPPARDRAAQPVPRSEVGPPAVVEFMPLPASAPDVAPLDSERVVQRFSDLGWNVTSLAFSPDGRVLAVGKMDSAVILFEVPSGRRLSEQTNLRPLGQITALSFTPDGLRLMLGGSSGMIQVWHLGAGGLLESAGMSDSLSVHQKAVRCIAPAPDGSFLVTGGEDNRLAWQRPGPTFQARTLASLEQSIRAIRLTSDGEVALASDGKELVWVDLQTSTITRKLSLAPSTVHAVSLAQDGSQIACSHSYAISVWETETSRMRSLETGKHEIQWSLVFTPDGRRLLSGGQGNFRVWEIQTGQQTACISLGTVLYVQTMAVSPDGTLVAAVPSAAGQTLYVFRLSP